MKYIDAQIPELVARARNGDHIAEDEDGLAIAIVRWVGSLGADETSDVGKLAYARVETMMVWQDLTQRIGALGERASREDWQAVIALRNTFSQGLGALGTMGDPLWFLTQTRGQMLAMIGHLKTVAGEDKSRVASPEMADSPGREGVTETLPGGHNVGGRADATSPPADVAKLARDTDISVPAAYAAKEAIDLGDKHGLKFIRIELNDLTWCGVYEAAEIPPGVIWRRDVARGEVWIELTEATAYLRQLEAEGEIAIPIHRGQIWQLADRRRILLERPLGGDEHEGYWKAAVIGTPDHVMIHERFLADSMAGNRLELHEIIPVETKFTAERLRARNMDVTAITPAGKTLSGSDRAELLDYAERARDTLRQQMIDNPGTTCTFVGCEREDEEVGLYHIDRGLEIDVLLCPEHLKLVREQIEATDGERNGKAVQITVAEDGSPVTMITADPTLG